jgi:hypothetical protein
MRTNARFLVASLALIGALAAIPAQAPRARERFGAPGSFLPSRPAAE